MKNKKRTYLLLILLLLPLATWGQKGNVLLVGDSVDCVRRHCPYLERQSVDSAHLQQRSLRCLRRLRNLGYSHSVVDSIYMLDNNYVVDFYVGRNYRNVWILVPDSLQPLWQTAVPKRWLNDDHLAYTHYPEVAEQVVVYLENHGYPFATVSLQDLNPQNDTLAYLQIDRNQYVTFDSVIVKGNVKLKPFFLYPFLGWQRGRPYNEQVVSQISQKIAKLPFLTATAPAGVEFIADKAYLFLFLEKRPVNQFDGYIGLVPISEKSGKPMFTGELNLHFQNIFAVGETVKLQWKSPIRYSQYLFLQADFPYLFRLPLGVKGEFVLDKVDTTYLNMNYLAALKYSFAGDNYLQLHYQHTTSNLLTQNPSGVLVVGDTLLTSYRKDLYGIELYINQLDDLGMPQRGFSLRLSGAVGQRRIFDMSPSVVYADASFAHRSVSSQLSGAVAGYVMWGKRWGSCFRLDAAWQSGHDHLFNELYRIGGTTTLQGFDEWSIYASSYAIVAADVRWWVARYSYLNLFVNAAWYERKLHNVYYSDLPLGFGVGAHIYTKAGIFYISYALGQQKGSPLSFKTGKIHFGMTVQF